MKGVIDISEFTSYLKKCDLIIVSRLDYEERMNHKENKLKELQKKYLDKEYLDFREILAGKLLPVHTRQSLNNWINNGTFKIGETFISPDDNRTKIVTSAIKRLRKLKNYDL